jgi:hypothetical protein
MKTLKPPINKICEPLLEGRVIIGSGSIKLSEEMRTDEKMRMMMNGARMMMNELYESVSDWLVKRVIRVNLFKIRLPIIIKIRRPILTKIWHEFECLRVMGGEIHFL